MAPQDPKRPSREDEEDWDLELNEAYRRFEGAIKGFSMSLRDWRPDHLPERYYEELFKMAGARFLQWLADDLGLEGSFSGPPLIVCMESLWTQELERRLSVEPMLEMLRNLGHCRLMHFPCSTRDELRHNIKKVGQLDPGERGLLYFAMHGAHELVALDEGGLDLSQIALLMDDTFRGWIVHFGTCLTMGTTVERIERFREATKLGCVSGYCKTIGWAEGTALDFLLFDFLISNGCLQRGVLPERMDEFAKRYRTMVNRTGLTWSIVPEVEDEDVELDLDDEE